MRGAITTGIVMTGLAVAAPPGNAQRSDSSRATPPSGAFAGIITNAVSNTPVQSADLRLFFIDSIRLIRGGSGDSSIDTFVDSARSRLAVSDSTGAFAIWRLAAGRYLMNVRRIGFAPIERGI